ncbi:MAG: amidohydrolase [Oscillospiraceae bacterium]|nr:amidohydrolase [Oscillospiraceae bacterium]
MSANTRLELTEADLRARELLRDFVPDKVFDAHAHLYAKTPGAAELIDYTYESYCAQMGPMLCDPAVIRINALPHATRNAATPEGRQEENRQIYERLDAAPNCVGCAFVGAGDSRERVEQIVDHPGIKGLKCYAHTTGAANPNACAINEYLPESAWEVANEKKLSIVLHMMRPAALADPENFDQIVTMVKRYPDAKLVLAHCARSFASWTGVETIGKLSHLENVWFDLSAITEPAPMMACIKATAGKRVMWGSDYPITLVRGKVVSINDSFAWITGAACDALSDLFRRYNVKPCFVAQENLLAVRQAALLLDLDRTQVEDIFYNNAMNLYGLKD